MAITREPSPSKYADRYKRVAFHVWYSKGRPPITKLVNFLPTRDDGTKPSATTVALWRREEDWDDQADELDDQVATDIRKQLVTEQIQIYQEHLDIGKAMRVKAIDWLETHELETPNEAMRLLEIATNLEQKSVGVSKVIKDIAQMEEDEVKDELRKLLKGDKLIEHDELKGLLDE